MLGVVMRLNKEQVKIIVNAVLSYFGEGAHIYLFGSRLNDKLKGGDIDLPEIGHETVRHSCQAIAEIQMALGEQKIDLIVRHPGSSDQAIFHEALTHGVLLQ